MTWLHYRFVYGLRLWMPRMLKSDHWNLKMPRNFSTFGLIFCMRFLLVDGKCCNITCQTYVVNILKNWDNSRLKTSKSFCKKGEYRWIVGQFHRLKTMVGMTKTQLASETDDEVRQLEIQNTDLRMVVEDLSLSVSDQQQKCVELVNYVQQHLMSS